MYAHIHPGIPSGSLNTCVFPVKKFELFICALKFDIAVVTYIISDAKFTSVIAPKFIPTFVFIFLIAEYFSTAGESSSVISKSSTLNKSSTFTTSLFKNLSALMEEPLFKIASNSSSETSSHV